MNSSDIRSRFLAYFESRGHTRVASASLVPADDPTLLFTNAGMVQFKGAFLGDEQLPYRRAVTAQKCVRAGGKHNDLEQVGHTARHHTFFEMLGNFSFGDYFKRDAVAFAWEFLTGELGLDPDRLYVTVHHTDDEAFELWREVAGIHPTRIFRLGDRDNFWQMADTGPCGPCSELHYDLRPAELRSVPELEEFEGLGEEGILLELWNLVFMQFDRDEGGTLSPLPAPSIDTGAGLERLAAALQGVDSNYHTDLFLPLLQRVARVVGRPYDATSAEGPSYRVLADHARAVAFLLADGVFPANDGRGYVLRRILRRAGRHAWLLGLRKPILVEVVDEVVQIMGEAYPELLEAREHLLRATRQEEERFLATIEGGMARFDELAPPSGEGEDVIPGEEVFRLYDTFGFPVDLTEIMAAERGYRLDEEGFRRALEAQRERSRADRSEAEHGTGRLPPFQEWVLLASNPEQRWVGWEEREVSTQVLALIEAGGRVALILRDNPFYLEAGGQVSDGGMVEGEGWTLRVEDLARVEGWTALLGTVKGVLPGLREGAGSGTPAVSESVGSAAPGDPLRVVARVTGTTRHNTERNHTVTHLLHAALRRVLGGHVAQKGSLVAPDRLRFDFSHPAPLTHEEMGKVEGMVNEVIWADHPVRWRITSREEALAAGAMALFGEKYGDEVRVVEIPGVSLELCGGTHLRHTGEAGFFRITRESGVAAGVRRIEGVTGPGAHARLRESEELLEAVARSLKTKPELALRRVEEVLAERDRLEELLVEARQGGRSPATVVHDASVPLGNGDAARYRGLRLRVQNADDARAFGDHFRETEAYAVAVVVTEASEGKPGLFAFVTDDLVGKGVRAGTLVQEIAGITGGRGGGRPHMAQGGIEDASRVDEALAHGEAVLRRLLETGG